MTAPRLVPRLSWEHGEPRATYHYVTDADAAKLEAVIEAAIAKDKAFEDQGECLMCEDRRSSMAGPGDPWCDVCMERWAVTSDAFDDAIEALGARP